jgi:putative ABC transport system permease protein
MTAVGASLRDVGAFLWTEAAIVLVASLILGGVLGWLLSLMLVAMLQHVFDPPPDALSVPWAYLAELALGSILSATVAVLLTVRALGRMQLGAILREQ